MSTEQHPFDRAADLAHRLAKVAPRITYVILCWETSTCEAINYNALSRRPEAILGPFTEREATSLAVTLTCECEVTNVTTEPPAWATKGGEGEAPTA